MKRQVDLEIARIKKLEEKPKKKMSLLQYYKLNAIKRPEFKQRIALGKLTFPWNLGNKNGNKTHVLHQQITLITKYMQSLFVSVLAKITELKGYGLLLTKIRVSHYKGGGRK